MSQTVPSPPLDLPEIPRIVRVTPDLFHAAALRLVTQHATDIESAAKGLVAAAPDHGIDLSLAWVTLEAGSRKTPKVRQACLAVPGAGRTVMLFISEPPPRGDPGGREAGEFERAAVIDEACRVVASEFRGRVHIAQSLPEPADAWAIAALRRAEFIKVGDLAYLRREPRALDARGKPGAARDDLAPLPPGVTVVRVADVRASAADSLLIEALDASYADTLDCPELCGMRDTADVLDSHRSTGVFDPALWWIVLRDGKPSGCALFNCCPEQRCAELVYIGLGPTLRGLGLGRRLLRQGITRTREAHPSWSMTCAVDHRNEPAMSLYRSLGFRSFGDRVALVRTLR